MVDLDEVLINFGRATTQTEITPERRQEAIKIVFDYLAEQRRLTGAAQAPTKPGQDEWKSRFLDAIKALHDALDVIEAIDSECLLPGQLKDLVDETLAPRLASSLPSTNRECPFCSRRVFEPCQSIAQAQNACTLSSTSRNTPVMQAAENAAKVVDGWSDSKKEYADRVVSPASQGGAA